jgi:hypothetical protein
MKKVISQKTWRSERRKRLLRATTSTISAKVTTQSWFGLYSRTDTGGSSTTKTKWIKSTSCGLKLKTSLTWKPYFVNTPIRKLGFRRKI